MFISRRVQGACVWCAWGGGGDGGGGGGGGGSPISFLITEFLEVHVIT